MGKGARARMEAAKGAVMALLTTAYQRRDRIALIAFQDRSASVLLPPTSSVALAQQRLRELPTGGATPLGDALVKTRELVRSARLKTPGIDPVVVLISDGEATVPVTPGGDAFAEALALARALVPERIHIVAVDTKPDAWFAKDATEMRQLADAMHASYVCLHRVRAQSVLDAVTRTGVLG